MGYFLVISFSAGAFHGLVVFQCADLITMEDDKPIWTTRQAIPATPTPVVRKPDIEEEFEIKEPFLSMISKMNFDGKIIDDPLQHVETFLDICDLFKVRGASSDAVRLRLFPFSLSGEAKTWVKTLVLGNAHRH